MILCYWYQKQEMTVRWCACISDNFKMTNGVRQGGILSSQLFNIYIDGLSDILNKQVNFMSKPIHCYLTFVIAQKRCEMYAVSFTHYGLTLHHLA